MVELSKEEYIIVSCKHNRNILGLCMMQSFNKDDAQNLNEKHHIGDELDVLTS